MRREPKLLSIENVSLAYERNEQINYALQDISLEFDKGSWTAIVGVNGSGKSTLAKLIAGLSKPTHGQITMAKGVQVHIVLQNPETQMIGDTIDEEISLSLDDLKTADRKIRIREILEEVGLYMPLETLTHHLSGGEKQLLNIATAIAAGANLFVLDEVTSMLDHASRDRVLQIMQQLHNNGATIIWLTHRSEELGYAERVIVLDDRHVSYDGSAQHFLYGDDYSMSSPCEQWGIELPYVVQVVKLLEQRGYSLHEQPLLPQELSQAIKERCL